MMKIMIVFAGLILMASLHNYRMVTVDEGRVEEMQDTLSVCWMPNDPAEVVNLYLMQRADTIPGDWWGSHVLDHDPWGIDTLICLEDSLMIEIRQHYRVAAFNSFGISPWSNVVSILYVDFAWGTGRDVTRVVEYQDDHCLVVDVMDNAGNWDLEWERTEEWEMVIMTSILDFNGDGDHAVSDLVYFSDYYNQGLFDMSDFSGLANVYARPSRFIFQRGTDGMWIQIGRMQ